MTKFSPAFFQPRVIHFSPHYEERVPRWPVSKWRDPKPSLGIRLKRVVLHKTPQGSSSPPGMSMLPHELLFQIFKELCGKEISAARLVCTDWETSSRPFFAERYLNDIVFWLVPSQLHLLDQFTSKFGLYINQVHIALDHFTFTAFFQAYMRYLRYFAFFRPHQRPTRCTGNGKAALNPSYFGAWCKGNIHHRFYDRRRCIQFFVSFLGYVVSQKWLHFTSQDAKLLSALSPAVEITTVLMDYHPDQLQAGSERYGKAAPRYPYELAAFCVEESVLLDPGYISRVQNMVQDVMERKCLNPN